jgi:hypothetical protein
MQLSKLAPIGKALAACALAGLGSLYVAVADNQLTAKELIGAAIVTLTALIGTYAVPNTPKPDSAEADQAVADFQRPRPTPYTDGQIGGM